MEGEHEFFPFLLAAFEGLKQYASYNKLQRASLQLLAQAGGDATLSPWNFGDVFSATSVRARSLQKSKSRRGMC